MRLTSRIAQPLFVLGIVLALALGAPNVNSDNDQKVHDKEVAEILSRHPVVVFAPHDYEKKGEHFTMILLDTLEATNVEPHIELLDQTTWKGKNYMVAMHRRCQRSTLPQLFINGKHIGSSSDVTSMHLKGDFKKLLARELAPPPPPPVASKPSQAERKDL